MPTLSRACTFLSARTILYRDLKPSNIGLCGQGHVKVFDLGLSVVRPALGPTTATYEVRKEERGGGGGRKITGWVCPVKEERKEEWGKNGGVQS